MRRRPVALVMVLLTLGVLMAGCGSTRDDEKGRVTERIEEVWSAAGVDPDAAFLQGYDFTHRPGAAGCRNVADADDHWFASRTADLPARLVTQAELLRRVSEMLARKGFEVSQFRSTASETRILKARSAGERTFVELYADPEGSATLHLTRSPCAGEFDLDPGSPYVLEH